MQFPGEPRVSLPFPLAATPSLPAKPWGMPVPRHPSTFCGLAVLKPGRCLHLSNPQPSAGHLPQQSRASPCYLRTTGPHRWIQLGQQ